MKSNTAAPNSTLDPRIKYMLAVSILLPVQESISKIQLQHKIELLELKAEQRLINSYAETETAPVISKLKDVLHNLNYKKHKRGIAIFVSAIAEHVYYLDSAVEEKIDIDEFFEINDEVFKKNTKRKYSITTSVKGHVPR